MTNDQLKDNIFKLQEINSIREGNIKVLFNYFKSDVNCLIYFVIHHYPIDDQYKKGVSLGLIQTIRNNPNIKLINKSLLTFANNEKSKKGVYEVLLIDDDGNITEGSRSNIFFIKRNEVFTPPLESVLPGITRKYIISICNKLGIPVTEKNIHHSEITEFDSVFITSTSNNVLPVADIHEFSFNPKNSVLHSIMNEFDKLLENYIKNFS